MILQWLKKRKINKLEVKIAKIEAKINYLSRLRLPNGNLSGSLALIISDLKSDLAGAQTKLKQLKND